MKSKQMRFLAWLLAGVCCLSVLGGCGSGKKAPGDGGEKNSSGQEEGADPVSDPEEGERVDPVSGQEEGAKDAQEGTADPAGVAEDQTDPAVNIGAFSMQDIYANSYTQEMFADYQLTMVNVFATWCSPCINEIPDLESLSQSMEEQEVKVVGIVLDAIGASGEVDQEAVEKAKALAERLEVTYPFLIPDETYLNGMLLGVSAVPTTFFVDQEGNLVGEVYLGSRSLEDWTGIVEAQLKEAAP